MSCDMLDASNRKFKKELIVEKKGFIHSTFNSFENIIESVSNISKESLNVMILYKMFNGFLISEIEHSCKKELLIEKKQKSTLSHSFIYKQSN